MMTTCLVGLRRAYEDTLLAVFVAAQFIRPQVNILQMLSHIGFIILRGIQFQVAFFLTLHSYNAIKPQIFMAC
jgi:hypothetical protein